jgi:glyoxylate reductase
MVVLELDQLYCAGLEVFDHEWAVDPKLVQFKNVVLPSHMGSARLESHIAKGNKIIVSIKTLVDGRPPTA